MPLQERKQRREGERLLPLVIFSANWRASTLFVAMRMSAGISDWSTFKSLSSVSALFGRTDLV